MRDERSETPRFNAVREALSPWEPPFIWSEVRILRLFLPDEIIAPRRTHLANVDRATPVYCAGCLHAGWPRAPHHFGSHRQLALRTDHFVKPISGTSRIMHASSSDVERPRFPVRTHPRLPVVRRVHRVDWRRRHEPILTVQTPFRRLQMLPFAHQQQRPNRTLR